MSVSFRSKVTSIHSFLNAEFKKLSLADLIGLSRKKEPSVSSYSDLFMVALLQEGQYKRSLTYKIDPFDVYMVTAFQQNSRTKVYTCPNLQRSLHFAVPESVAKEIHHRINFFRQSSASNVSITIIPNKQASFHDVDNSVFVSNMATSNESSGVSALVLNPPHTKNSSLQQAKALLLRSVEKGFLNNVKFVDKAKRGGTPKMSFGFTNNVLRLHQV